MKGFIRNEGDRAVFTMQRSMAPGVSLQLDDAYEVLGKKSGKKKGPSFVKWLREDYLTRGAWGFYKEEGVSYFVGGTTPEVVQTKVKPGGGTGKPLRSKSEEKQKEDISAEAIIMSDYSISKQLIEKCNNKAVLRKSLAASKHYTGKEQHMRHLIKRLEQVY